MDKISLPTRLILSLLFGALLLTSPGLSAYAAAAQIAAIREVPLVAPASTNGAALGTSFSGRSDMGLTATTGLNESLALTITPIVADRMPAASSFPVSIIPRSHSFSPTSVRALIHVGSLRLGRPQGTSLARPQAIGVPVLPASVIPTQSQTPTKADISSRDSTAGSAAIRHVVPTTKLGGIIVRAITAWKALLSGHLSNIESAEFTAGSSEKRQKLFDRYEQAFGTIFSDYPNTRIKAGLAKIKFKNSAAAGETNAITGAITFHKNLRESMLYPMVHAHEFQHLLDVEDGLISPVDGNPETRELEHLLLIEARAFRRQFLALKLAYDEESLALARNEKIDFPEADPLRRMTAIAQQFRDNLYGFTFVCLYHKFGGEVAPITIEEALKKALIVPSPQYAHLTRWNYWELAAPYIPNSAQK